MTTYPKQSAERNRVTGAKLCDGSSLKAAPKIKTALAASGIAQSVKPIFAADDPEDQRAAPTPSPPQSPISPGGASPTTKIATVLAMLGAASGATLADIMTVTGWQAHSVRGFLSGTVRRRLALELISETTENGERRYRLATSVHSETAPSDEPADIPIFLLKSKTDSGMPRQIAEAN